MDKSRLKWFSQCWVWPNTIIFGAKIEEWMTVTRSHTGSASLTKRVPVKFSEFASFYFILQCISVRRYVFESTRGDLDLEIMTIFLTSDRILHQGQRRLKSQTWTQRKWWYLRFTHFCSLRSCFRFNFSRLFLTMVQILFYILTLCFKLARLISQIYA